jgi:putative transposase
VSKEIRELIFKMVAENPTWRAPRIHGELVTLGYEVSERSVSRWMRHAPRSPESAQRWLSFLRNHREGIAAMDFLLVPPTAAVTKPFDPSFTMTKLGQAKCRQTCQAI